MEEQWDQPFPALPLHTNNQIRMHTFKPKLAPCSIILPTFLALTVPLLHLLLHCASVRRMKWNYLMYCTLRKKIEIN